MFLTRVGARNQKIYNVHYLLPTSTIATCKMVFVSKISDDDNVLEVTVDFTDQLLNPKLTYTNFISELSEKLEELINLTTKDYKFSKAPHRWKLQVNSTNLSNIVIGNVTPEDLIKSLQASCNKIINKFKVKPVTYIAINTDNLTTYSSRSTKIDDVLCYTFGINYILFILIGLLFGPLFPEYLIAALIIFSISFVVLPLVGATLTLLYEHYCSNFPPILPKVDSQYSFTDSKLSTSTSVVLNQKVRFNSLVNNAVPGLEGGI